ncbi:MAG TPA: chemotaxis protein CheW [bacterium]|nr:chemotaxis protein CheW [bacterium]
MAIAAAEEQGRKLNKYLTFTLGDEEYGLEILKVREIIGLMEITNVPRMPNFVRGVINLRGKVIPVIDLRQKFGMERADNTKETCIIVVDLDGLLMGIVVDKVSEVLDIQEQDIEETPTFGVSVDTEFIMGIGKAKGKIVIVLDIRRVLTAEEIKIISKTEKETGTK